MVGLGNPYMDDYMLSWLCYNGKGGVESMRSGKLRHAFKPFNLIRIALSNLAMSFAQAPQVWDSG